MDTQLIPSMPYVDNQIPWDKHKDDCTNPLAKRLYIRDYDDNGKQRFVSWGVTCTNCGVTLRQSYLHNLTKKQKERKEFLDKLSEYGEDLIGKRPYDQQIHLDLLRSKIRKLSKQSRRLLGGGPISRRENGLRRRIKGFKLMYNNDCSHYKILENKIDWDEELVRKFLATRPTESELHSVIYSSPLLRYDNNSADRLRGFIPDPSKEGRLVRDLSHYVPIPGKPGKWKWSSDPTIFGEFEKMVIKEVQIRKEKMQEIINRHQQKFSSE